MPHGSNNINTINTGGPPTKLNMFSRGLSLGAKFQARASADSDSSDENDDKEDWGKDAKTGKGISRRGSQVCYCLYNYTLRIHKIFI